MDAIKRLVLGLIMNKGVKSAAKLVVSWCFAQGVVVAAQPYGVQIDTTNEGVMVVAINSLLKLAFHWAKQKWPGKFEWLP